jgi:hypothetical protein
MKYLIINGVSCLDYIGIYSNNITKNKQQTILPLITAIGGNSANVLKIIIKKLMNLNNKNDEIIKIFYISIIFDDFIGNQIKNFLLNLQQEDFKINKKTILDLSFLTTINKNEEQEKLKKNFYFKNFNFNICLSSPFSYIYVSTIDKTRTIFTTPLTISIAKIESNEKKKSESNKNEIKEIKDDVKKITCNYKWIFKIF